MWWGLLLTICVAVLGGWILYRRRVPGGAMIGAMIAVAVWNIATGLSQFPPQTKILTQAASGAFIGIGLNRGTLRGLKDMIVPAVMVAIGAQMVGLCIGWVLWHISGLDPVTSMISTAPGGIVDMSLISMDMGADTTTVAALHSVRLIAVLGLSPAMLRLVAKLVDKGGGPVAREADEQPQEEKPAHSRRWVVLHNLKTLAIGLAGGLAGYLTGIPAGILLFSMIAVATYNVATDQAYMSGPVRRGAQMMAGALVGQGIGMEQLLRLRGLVLPAVAVVALYLFFNVVMGLFLHYRFKLDTTTALFATTPAGASDMALLAADIGADGPQVAVLQIVRLVTVIAFFPQIVRLIFL